MSLIIAAAQSASTAGEIEENVATHVRFAGAAAEHGVQLLIFPELSLIGYELAIAKANSIAISDPVLDPLRRLAVDHRMTIVVGAPVLNERDELNIAALVLRADGSVLTYAKEHVHSSEMGVFAPGSGGPTFCLGEDTVALAICRDATFPEHVEKAVACGANVYAASVMIEESDYVRKTTLLRRYAREQRIAVLMANCSGATGGSISAGKSAIWGENGQLVCTAAGTEKALVIGRRHFAEWQGKVVAIP